MNKIKVLITNAKPTHWYHKHLGEKIEVYEKAADILHEFILNNCGNSRLKKIIYNFRTLLKLEQKIAVSIPSRIETSYKEHREILDAMKKGNSELAEKKMRNHIISTYKDVLKQFE